MPTLCYNIKLYGIRDSSDMNVNYSKEQVFELICRAGVLGNLGLFIGSGFTKCTMEDNDDFCAYTWSELLEKCCNVLNVDQQKLRRNGSYSEFASSICKQYAENNNISYMDSILKLKRVVAELTNIYPTQDSINRFEKFFNININWIVTTNYDTVLESILLGKAHPLGPKDCFLQIKNLIPIFHIHGIRTNPDDIIITHEDYISLLRPYDYRQNRLPFLIKESIVVMLGYGLGDINVVTALDWSRNVYTNVPTNFETEIIQLVRVDKSPNPNPYKDQSGVIIIEINEIIDFFDELLSFNFHYSMSYQKTLNSIAEYIAFFMNPFDSALDDFINDYNKRMQIINFVTSLTIEFSYIFPSYLIFLEKIFARLKVLSMPNGAFDAYDKKLKVLIDLFEKLDVEMSPPSLFYLLATNFENVAGYIDGRKGGYAWDAQVTWNNEHQRIPDEVVKKLKDYSKAYAWSTNTKRLLRSFDK